MTYSSAAPDENVDSAVQAIQTAGGDVSGIAMAPAFGAALGAMKADGGELIITSRYDQERNQLPIEQNAVEEEEVFDSEEELGEAA